MSLIYIRQKDCSLYKGIFTFARECFLSFVNVVKMYFVKDNSITFNEKKRILPMHNWMIEESRALFHSLS